MGFGLNQVNNQKKQNHSGLGEPGCDNISAEAGVVDISGNMLFFVLVYDCF